ncbi:DNA damage-inducible protein D [Patescibacteria group bacterium]|nr:DNA damage-inducible protein D [Patescibacteria group bacterium]MBU1124266.1 DNA damage-inducible protein D [Patescibacteria group bacterium]MBU1911054.1 DNA damage-inducible protein D [Patescibacteria group bacterium]
MKQELITRLHKQFEDFVHTEDGTEYWLARELQTLLGYDQWRNFLEVVNKAKIACESNKHAISDHFADVSKMVEIGSGSQREVPDMKLTRYACYLIAQNGNPRKEEIAFAMNYFAVQTRKQEIIAERIAEWERLQAREKLSLSEKELSRLMYERGIDEKGFGRVRSKGDAALFGGVKTQDMKQRLGVPKKRALADFLPAVTIKAKDFATEVTNVQIQQKDLRSEESVTGAHVKNNTDVRKILTDRDIVPEKLPPAEDMQKVKRRLASEQKKLNKPSKKLK